MSEEEIMNYATWVLLGQIQELGPISDEDRHAAYLMIAEAHRTVLKQRDELRAALDLELSRRTLGGTPPPSDENWANQALPPPESATTGPTAPPDMRRSDDHLRERA